MPDFDSAFSIFASWQTAILCLGIHVIIFGARTVLESIFPRWKDSKVYTDLVLPLMPILVGLLLAFFATGFPWLVPAGLGRIFYSMICGLISGWAYNRLRAWMKV